MAHLSLTRFASQKQDERVFFAERKKKKKVCDAPPTQRDPRNSGLATFMPSGEINTPPHMNSSPTLAAKDFLERYPELDVYGDGTLTVKI